MVCLLHGHMCVFFVLTVCLLHGHMCVFFILTVCLLHGHMERTDFKKNQRSFIKEVNRSLVNLKFISDTSKQNAIF